MRRRSVSRMRILAARHPGLREKVNRMFEQLSRTREVRQMIQTQYGESLSTATVDRYKRQHWQAQREMVQEMSQIIGRSEDRVSG